MYNHELRGADLEAAQYTLLIGLDLTGETTQGELGSLLLGAHGQIGTCVPLDRNSDYAPTDSLRVGISAGSTCSASPEYAIVTPIFAK
jgi:hypothetical protein